MKIKGDNEHIRSRSQPLRQPFRQSFANLNHSVDNAHFTESLKHHCVCSRAISHRGAPVTIQTAFKGYITRLLRPDYHIHAYFQFVTFFLFFLKKMGKTKMDAGNIFLHSSPVTQWKHLQNDVEKHAAAVFPESRGDAPQWEMCFCSCVLLWVGFNFQIILLFQVHLAIVLGCNSWVFSEWP